MKNEILIKENNGLETITKKLVAVDKVFARAKKQMSINEFKFFYFALTNVDYTKKCPDEVTLDKKYVAHILGFTSNYTDISQNLKRELKNIHKHSSLEFQSEDKKIYEAGNFIRYVTFKTNEITIRFEDRYLGLFGNLEKNYITLYFQDIYKMKNESVLNFYEYLRKDCYFSGKQEQKIIMLDELKKILGLEPNAYINNRGNFDKSNFEKYVLNPLVKNFQQFEMITLYHDQNEKYYFEIKEGRKIIGYIFIFAITYNPKDIMIKPEEAKKAKKQLDKTREKTDKNNKNINNSPTYENMDDIEKNILSN